MNFREQLETAKQNNLDICDLKIADELNYQLNAREMSVNDERFEDLCVAAKYAYLKADNISSYCVCAAVADLEQEYLEDPTEDRDPAQMSKWDILDKALEYQD